MSHKRGKNLSKEEIWKTHEAWVEGIRLANQFSTEVFLRDRNKKSTT